MRNTLLGSLIALLGACQAQAPHDSAAPARVRVPARVAAKVPAGVREVLENADSFELLSLYPYPRGYDAKLWAERGYDKGETAGDYAVLGATALDASGRAMVLNAVYEGIAASDGMVAACFNPRHALRARKGDTVVEAIICFECLSITLRRNGEHAGSVTTTSTPGTKLTAILRDAGVTLPDA
jgi:hypothetical protein